VREIRKTSRVLAGSCVKKSSNVQLAFWSSCPG